MRDSLVVDGGILAGGRATRMLGQDKGLQLYQNKPMAAWVYQALSPHVRKVIINCNRNFDSYRRVSPYLCSDTLNDFPGPLAGLISLIEASDADYFLVSPCDTPQLTQSFGYRMLTFLAQQLDQKNRPQLLAVCCNEKQQPLHLCISREYKHSLEAYLAKGEHRVMHWMHENHAKWLDFSSNSAQFRNFNSLEELRSE